MVSESKLYSLFQLGVTNPLEYPLCVDKICGRNFAIRTKWQPVWDSCSVQALKEDDAIINKIKELFPNDEVSFPTSITIISFSKLLLFIHSPIL
jgi:hypothetical protein